MNNPDFNMASFMQDMMQLLMKHRNINPDSASNVKTIHSKTLNDALLEFESDYKTTLKESSYNRSVKHRIKFLAKSFGSDKLVCDITEQELKDLINTKLDKPYEREQLRKLVNKIFDWFVEKKYTFVNPAAKIKKFKIQKLSIVTIDLNHFRKILDYMRDNYAKEKAELYNDIFILLLQSGLRPNELLSLIKRNISINENEKVASLKIDSTKNYLARTVPVVGIGFDIILKYYQNAKQFNDWIFPGRITRKKQDHLAVDSCSKIFKKACNELSYPDNYCMYSLRATFASYLFTEEKDLMKISKLLGHRDIKTTIEYYARLLSNKDKETIAMLRESEINKINNLIFNELKKVV